MTVNIHTASIGESATRVQEYVRLIAWQHRYFAAIIVAYGAAAIATASVYDNGALVSPMFRYTALSVLATLIVYGLAWWRPGWLARALPPDGRENGLPSQRVLQGLLVVVLLPVFFGSFSVFKKMIPAINPFSWDSAFATWDALLHGGTDPWRLLQPMLGYSAVTKVLDLVYALWFFVVFGAFLWQAFSVSRADRRMRFLLSFVLSWIAIGTLAAIVLSSAGPVYFAPVTGEESSYAELMAYLYSVGHPNPLIAVQTHDMLWETYTLGEAQLGHGISAMPSMHVAAAVLTLCLFWRSRLVVRIAAVLFVAVIFLGSIHLAWHYAIDGYVAAAMAWAIWRAARPLAKRALAPR